MKIVVVATVIERLHNYLKEQPRLTPILAALAQAGARPLLVGGAVRDLFLNVPIKDLDIEVHGLLLDQLEALLARSGTVSAVGKVYGVLRVHGLDVDWSVPRREGPGRKPTVETGVPISMREAFERRDLTMNAMGIDLTSFELIDPCDGLKDLQNGVLRACNEQRFIDDPLRLYRVMQFVGRFALQPDDHLNKVCASMDVASVSVERIEEEVKKLLLKSKKPSLGFRWINAIGRLKELFPELGALVGVEQNEQWHPEKDVFEHTMQTADATACLSYASESNKLFLLYAALCHDMGKAVTTRDEDGVLKSKGHAEAGVALTKLFLQRITKNKELIDTVTVLVRHHMAPWQFIHGQARLSAYKRLAAQLAPQATLSDLAQLALADRQGRNPHGHDPLTQSSPDIEAFRAKAHEAQVFMNKEEPVLHGRDLLDVVPPGPILGELVRAAYDIQLEEGIKDKEELKRRVLVMQKQD